MSIGSVAELPDFTAMRRNMVDSQLRTSDVNDPAVIAAILAVPREAFVPEARRATCYMDRAVPLAPGRMLNPPLAAGLLLSRAGINVGDIVLVVASGTGYLAAAAAQLAGRVVALEEDVALTASAASNLADYTNVETVTGSLVDGHAAAGPYDVILIDGAVEQVPDQLTAHLADGGRLVTGINQNGVTRLAIGRKTGGTFGLTVLSDSDFIPLPQFAVARTYIFQ